MDSIHRFCYSDVQFIGSLRVIHVSITFFAVYKRMTYVNMLCQGYVLLLCTVLHQRVVNTELNLFSGHCMCSLATQP